MASDSFKRQQVQKVFGNSISAAEDILAAEEPLEIAVSYFSGGKSVSKTISVTMRTPGNDEELATGFLFTEGIIKEPTAVHSAIIPEENKVLVQLSENAVPALQQADRNFYTTSSCGVCGKTSIDAIKTVSAFSEAKTAITVNASHLYSLPEKLRAQQKVFEQTGGLHASALFDATVNLLLLREDVGRHNALDKLIGAAMKENILPLTSHILLLSGRASFELVQKAVMAGIKIVVAIGAPSTLAAELAAEAGITLAGFLKSNTFNIYTHPERITFDS